MTKKIFPKIKRMHSHNFRTGLLAKKNFNRKDIWHLLHSMTPAQSSMFREVIKQHLGVKPSHYWGKQKIWFQLPNRDRETLIYLLEAFNHAPHITSDKISRNKKAGSWISAAGEALADGAKAGAKYAAKGAKFLAEHGSQILHGIDTGLNVASQAGQAAHQLGLVSDDSAITQMSDLYQSVRGAWAGDEGGSMHAPRESKKFILRKLGHLL
jgi:hypothetical protein